MVGGACPCNRKGAAQRVAACQEQASQGCESWHVGGPLGLRFGAQPAICRFRLWGVPGME